MTQPQYTRQQVEEMTNAELARKLRSWAKAREAVSERRQKKGKEPLDAHLLTEAATRLEGGAK